MFIITNNCVSAPAPILCNNGSFRNAANVNHLQHHPGQPPQVQDQGRCPPRRRRARWNNDRNRNFEDRRAGSP